MNAFYSRILYLISTIAWVLLLWPNPVTIFLAGCFSCLTIPIYRYLRKHINHWRMKMEASHPGRLMRIFMALTNTIPVTLYTIFTVSVIFMPIAILALLVSPQALAGYQRLKELRASNFQLPPQIMTYVQDLKELLHEYPRIEKFVYDGLANIDSIFSDAVSILVSRSFGVVGSTMNILWLIFLFLTLTVLFTVYASVIRKVSGRLFNLPQSLLGRFIDSIHRALKAIILGIAFVALVQGSLCGIAFAVIGISQPAFWGLLATMVAPIPMIGTSLVWGPLCISLWFSGQIMAAVGLAIWGGIFVSAVDNVLRPFFLRQGIEASFFVLILSILCGMSMFGAIGLIAGPILLAICIRAYDEAGRYYQLSIKK